IATAKNLVVIASTWGEGDPPQRAASFYKGLMAESAPSLAGVRFAVLALGDTAYTNFCATGRAVDERLEALGATRIVDRVDLDLALEKKPQAWIDGRLTTLHPFVTEHPTAANFAHVDLRSAAPASEPDEPAFDAENPLEAEITEIVNLNGTGSTSETWHVEL